MCVFGIWRGKGVQKMFGFWVCKYVRESFVSYINYNDVLQCWWYGKWFCCTFWMYFILGAFRLYWNFYFFFVGCECVCTLWIFNVHYGFLTASAILSMQNKTKNWFSSNPKLFPQKGVLWKFTSFNMKLCWAPVKFWVHLGKWCNCNYLHLNEAMEMIEMGIRCGP